MSSPARKASLVVVAASIAAVEALKDQGFARWNYPIRRVSQHLQAQVGSYLARSARTEDASAATRACGWKEGAPRRLEENHRKVMEISCWGPDSIRF
ncbi:hypothetical protein MLD38_022019 [Melastoma candidum]|uniref:Uncharacterized protein n=1 Tax=Melastoma candidum TaxID=119954 RepID=A0ACB9QJ38_9MYRT|nr:hypothetical protein MLD38_022019 [Melastoma candidum]